MFSRPLLKPVRSLNSCLAQRHCGILINGDLPGLATLFNGVSTKRVDFCLYHCMAVAV